MGALITFFLSPVGRIVGYGLAIATLLAGFAFYFDHQGANRILAKQERADNEARQRRATIDEDVSKIPLGDLDKRFDRWVKKHD